MFEKLKATLSQAFEKEQVEESDDQQVAKAAAMLLLEVAWADHVIEPNEIELIEAALKSLYGTSQEDIAEILDYAQRTHAESTDIHSFTQTLNEVLNLEERQQLLVALWRLNEFDGSEFHYEESVIRKIANLLYLSHSDFIAAKLSAKTRS